MPKINKKVTFTKKSLTNDIMGIFGDNPEMNFHPKQLAKQLRIQDIQSRQLITEILKELAVTGTLIELKQGKFKLRSQRGYIIGTVDLTSKGYAYILPDEGGEDVFVSQKNLNSAINGDKVKVNLYARKKKFQPEGEVAEVLQRGRDTFVGTVQHSGHFAFVIPDNRKMPYDIFIPPDKINHAENGQKVIVKLLEWPTNTKHPVGEIIEILGQEGEHETEMHAILAEFGLPHRFPEEIEEVASHIELNITKEEISKRRDFRSIPTFTIDPEDAKDFDDALSLRKMDNEKWEVGVHIADVTHFVKPHSLLDKEALERATSVYLVDRVVPMLPEHLSNFICSLNPDEERLCFSAVFEMDEQAVITKEWFGKTVIRSGKRFSYEEAQQVIETEKGIFSDELKTLNELAKTLREKRFDNGSIGFEKTEVKFVLDETGKPLRIKFRKFQDSNRLIEEFMLLANKKVAERIGKPGAYKKKNTFIYRIHDKPDMVKMNAFAQFIKQFGYSVKTSSDSAIAGSLNRLLEKIRDNPMRDVIENLAIRSMSKAIYSVYNIGHYGLAFPYYTHFTSPIRRYPDMMVHRLLEHYLMGGKPVNEDIYGKMCKHSSDMEQKAAEAERSSVKYKQVEFMKDHIGEIFKGMISGVSDRGIFVKLSENQCEGMVSVRCIDDDYYACDEEKYCLTGRHTGKKYQMGDILDVKIHRINLAKKQLDFCLPDKTENKKTHQNQLKKNKYKSRYGK